MFRRHRFSVVRTFVFIVCIVFIVSSLLQSTGPDGIIRQTSLTGRFYPSAVNFPALRSKAFLLQEQSSEQGQQQTLSSAEYDHKQFLRALLATCTNTHRSPAAAKVLANVAGLNGVASRAIFRTTHNNALDHQTPPRFNPNILPYPRGAVHPYLGFAQQAPTSIGQNELPMGRHSIFYCDMDWVMSDLADHRRELVCQDAAMKLDIPPPVATTAGACTQRPELENTRGFVEPRVIRSPSGEPLLIVGSSSVDNCISQYIVDLRTLIPDLASKMKINELSTPIRFRALTMLPRPTNFSESEHDYTLLFDSVNHIFVEQSLEPRSITALSTLDTDADQEKVFAIDNPESSFKCFASLLKRSSDPANRRTFVQQATNTLRVTLCEWPCEPTIENTVLISIMHVKYQNFDSVHYQRHLVAMSPTAPFEILARSSPLHYAGIDERDMVYTSQIAWDHMHFRSHSTASTVVAPSRGDYATAKRSVQQTNSLVSDHHHGWLDDTIMISISINNQETAVLHSSIADLLGCLQLC
ncbi:hypothetical protein BZA70DRAFT_290211 [Myxozyma melibiosi]|uniref:Membrane-associated protein n=1 Tax=Myxozyma melibiosi TaxID=54550 RepID=A0ABR1F515_9ASCO